MDNNNLNEEKNENNISDDYKDSYEYFKLKTVHDLMKNDFEYAEYLFKLRDEKSNNFLNISILVLTIEVSFLAAGISKFLSDTSVLTNNKIIFLIIYFINILFNLASIYYLYHAYSLSKYKRSLDAKTIYEYYFGDENGEVKEVDKILNQSMTSMHDAIEFNYKQLDNKTEKLKIGCTLLLLSIIFLVFSVSYYLIIMVR